MSKKHTVTTSFLWSFLEQGSAKLIQMIVQVVLARLLAPREFGVLAVLLVVTNVADSIAQSGFGMALIQKSDVDDASYDTAFWISGILAVIVYATIFVFAPVISSFYGMAELVFTLRILAFTVLFNAVNSIQRSYMQRRMDFKGLFRISLSAVIGSGMIGVASALAGWGVWSLVAQTLSQSVLTCLAMALVVPWRPRFRFRRADALELYGYGWKVCVTGILNVFYTGVSELILGRACSPGELGYYSQGRKYPNAAIGVASNAISNVLFPAFADVKGDSARMHGRIRKGLKLGTFLMAPISLCAAVTAEPVVAMLLGEAWLPCVPIFALTCAANSIVMLQTVSLRAYMALGRSDLYMKLQVVKVLLGVVGIGGTALVSHDIYATAWATFLIGLFNVLVVDLAPAGRVLGYARLRQVRDVAPSLALAAGAGALAWAVSLLNLPYPSEFLLEVALYCAVYLGAARAFRMRELEEAAVRLKALFGGGEG